jgi:hypothetical protein
MLLVNVTPVQPGIQEANSDDYLTASVRGSRWFESIAARPSWAEQRLSKRRPQPDADEQTRNILDEALVKLRKGGL